MLTSPALLNGGAPWQSGGGQPLAGTTAPATISPQAAGGQDFVMPLQPNMLQWYPAMTLRVQARGTLRGGAAATALTLFLAAGMSGALGTVLLASAPLILPAGATADAAWKWECMLRVRSLSSIRSTVSCGGEWEVSAGAPGGTFGTAGGATTLMMPETGAPLNTAMTGTAVGLRAQFSAAAGRVACTQFTIEQLC